MSQGILRLKKDAGGNRHYIELPDGSHDDIRCGSQLEVQLGKWKEVEGGEELLPDRWIRGRYEGNLTGCEKPVANLVLGDFYPDMGYMGEYMICVLPVGVTVRRPERGESD